MHFYKPWVFTFSSLQVCYFQIVCNMREVEVSGSSEDSNHRHDTHEKYIDRLESPLPTLPHKMMIDPYLLEFRGFGIPDATYVLPP